MYEGNPLARVHSLSGKGRHFVTLSTERPNISAEERNRRNSELETNLKKQGYGYRKVRGHYEGSTESSYLVHAKKEGAESGKRLVKDMAAHGRRYGQDTILHHNPETGKARLVGTNKTAGWIEFKKKKTIGNAISYKSNPENQTEIRPKSTEKKLKPGRTPGSGKTFSIG